MIKFIFMDGKNVNKTYVHILAIRPSVFRLIVKHITYFML